jgi:hypothetical protein
MELHSPCRWRRSAHCKAPVETAPQFQGRVLAGMLQGLSDESIAWLDWQFAIYSGTNSLGSLVLPLVKKLTTSTDPRYSLGPARVHRYAVDRTD